MSSVTVGERILVHLSGLLRHADAYECPVEMTQDGIAAALSLSRAHVALELKRLKSTGKVGERMAHVTNARSRRKVYELTPAGQEISRRMRDHARTRTVELSGPEGRRVVLGAEAIEALRRAGLREAEAVQRVLAAEVVELPRPAPKAGAAVPSHPFFGRTEQGRILREWLASDSRGVAVVVGVAGIGKSAFVAHVAMEAGRPTLFRRVYAHDDAHALLCSFADFLARQGRRRLKAAITRPAYDPVEAIAVLREDLSGCALVLDDLHACPSADALLRALAERPLDAKILVASRTQPTFFERPDLVAGRVVEVWLTGLDERSAEALLASRGATLAPGETHRVIAATGGHPLALEMFATSGLDAGAVETERYVLETVLEDLDDEAEDLLRTFAVFRRPARSPEVFGATVSQLRRLVRRALLDHREEGYLIHDLIKEFFLRRMPETQMRAAHMRAAAYWADRGDGLEETHHRIEAGDLEGAASRLIEIGPGFAESARAGDLEAALLRVPRDPRLEELLAEAEMFLGRFEEARVVLGRIVATGAPSERLRAHIRLGRIANRLGSYPESRTMLAEAVREATALSDPSAEGEALRALGAVERRLGDLSAAIAHLERAATILDTEPREKIRALIDLGAALIARGDYPQAKAHLSEAAAMSRHRTRDDAAIQSNLGIVLSREGDPHRAAAAFERSAEIALGAGDVRFASIALANAVENFLRLEAVDAAATSAERALRLAQTIGDPVALSTAQANLGLVCAKRGEWAKAEQHLLGSVDLIARLDNPYSLASRYQALAQLYDAQGRGADAAPWRARADDLFARLHAGSPTPSAP